MTSLSGSSSEHELVARLRRGDDRAFEELYSRYRRRIMAYVLGMVGDHGRAEDITQEVFISALRRMRDTERPIAFKPWIYEIAKNACIDASRRARRAREVSLEVDEEPATRLGPPSSVATFEGAVQAKQQLNDLRGAFGCLSESHHQILVMRELEGLSYAQIGEQLGMSRPVVESTLFRARRRLGEEYEELVSGRRCAYVQSIVAEPAGGSFGVRERRRLARHLAHCQPCRRQARLAGFDDSALTPRRLAGKIAALLPVPVPLLRIRASWRARVAARDMDVMSRWQSPVVLRSVDTFTRLAEPAGGSIGLGRAAAAVVAVAIAGTSGGLLVSRPAAPAVARRAPSTAGPAARPAAAAALPALPPARVRLRMPAAGVGFGATLPAAKPVRLSAADPGVPPAIAPAAPRPQTTRLGKPSADGTLNNTGSTLHGQPGAPGLPGMPLHSPTTPGVPKLPAPQPLPVKSVPSMPSAPKIGGAALPALAAAQDAPLPPPDAAPQTSR